MNYREEQSRNVINSADVVDAISGEALERTADVVRPGDVVVTLFDAPLRELVTRFREEHIASTFAFLLSPAAQIRSPPESLYTSSIRGCGTYHQPHPLISGGRECDCQKCRRPRSWQTRPQCDLT